MSGRNFEVALQEFDRNLAAQAMNRPFTLIVDEAVVTRGKDGKYVSIVAGKEHPAVSDGDFGVDEFGILHFSLEENPLG